MKKMQDSEETFIKVAKAARIMSVSTSTLKKFIFQGKLRAVKTPGGHYRIRMKDLMEDLYSDADKADISKKT